MVKCNPIRIGYHLPAEILINHFNVLNIRTVKDCFPMWVAYVCFKEVLKQHYLLNFNFNFAQRARADDNESDVSPSLNDLSKKQHEIFKKDLSNPVTYKKYLKRFYLSPLSAGEVTFEEMAAFVDINKNTS